MISQKIICGKNINIFISKASKSSCYKMHLFIQQTLFYINSILIIVMRVLTFL